MKFEVERFKHKSVASMFCYVGFEKVSNETKQESHRKPAKTMTSLSDGWRADGSRQKMKIKIKMNTPSVAQNFSFQTGKQVAEGKLAAGLQTKRGLLMSSQI